jgi:hypothetical protein
MIINTIENRNQLKPKYIHVIIYQYVFIRIQNPYVWCLRCPVTTKFWIENRADTLKHEKIFLGAVEEPK